MIYIQTAEGLTPISSSLSKEKILAALGYTPADNATFFEDESGALVIGDERGYAIARIDKDGLTTTKIRRAAKLLNAQGVPTYDRTFVCSATGLEQLLGTTVVTNSVLVL